MGCFCANDDMVSSVCAVTLGIKTSITVVLWIRSLVPTSHFDSVTNLLATHTDSCPWQLCLTKRLEKVKVSAKADLDIEATIWGPSTFVSAWISPTWSITGLIYEWRRDESTGGKRDSSTTSKKWQKGLAIPSRRRRHHIMAQIGQTAGRREKVYQPLLSGTP